MNFERVNKNPLSTMGIGKTQLIKDWLDEMGVKNYTIKDDLTIDVKYDVDLSLKNLIKFPEYIKFNKITGWFSCANNQLTSLRGCPRIVGNALYYNYYFTCAGNNLTSLYGCPAIVYGDFYCYNNDKTFYPEYVENLCDVKGSVYSTIGD
jgi:hypothetical protein